MAPVTDRISSLVCFGGAGGRGLGGGGLDGAGFPFFGWTGVAGGVGACGVAGSSNNAGGVSEGAGASKRFALGSSPVVANMSLAWLVNMLAAGVSAVLGSVVSAANEANGLVESTVAVGWYDCSPPKLRNGFSPGPVVSGSAKSWRNGFDAGPATALLDSVAP